jgi:CO/xanthine dehydrogenase Mo-binding subunit
MDIVADTSKPKNANTYEPLSGAHSGRIVPRAGIENLNVEILNKEPVLPTDRKWAIRFSRGETVTVVLGMRDYGRGWFSAYFAGLVAARLGLPFRRVRIYYSATLPAVSQTPRIAGILLNGSQPGSVAAAIGDIICEMCGLVIEKGRLASAAVAGVGAADVDFDASTGCFFARTTGWSGRTLDIAKMARDGRSVSTEFAKNLRGENTIATEAYEPSDA